jgi:hypothetical protein
MTGLSMLDGLIGSTECLVAASQARHSSRLDAAAGSLNEGSEEIDAKTKSMPSLAARPKLGILIDASLGLAEERQTVAGAQGSASLRSNDKSCTEQETTHSMPVLGVDWTP